MEQLAAGTGGTFFHDNNDLTHGLSSVLGIATVVVKQGTQPLAITDSDLTKV